MAGKKKLDTYGLSSYAGDAAPEDGGKKTNYNPKSLANLQTNHRPKAPTKYMQINIYEYEDYLYRMAKYNGMTVTKYIQKLITRDVQEHAAEYEQLRKLSRYDKPRRDSGQSDNDLS